MFRETSVLHMASRGEQHGLDVSHCREVQQHVHVFVPRKLFQHHRLFLFPHPPPALHGTLQVDRPVPVAKHHSGLHIGELVRVLEARRRGDAAAVQAVDSHAGGREVGHQGLGVLSHKPAVFETDVRVEALVVHDGVVCVGRLHQDLVVDGWKTVRLLSPFGYVFENVVQKKSGKI